MLVIVVVGPGVIIIFVFIVRKLERVISVVNGGVWLVLVQPLHVGVEPLLKGLLLQLAL